ncbi:MAG TPA: PQQ-binding-like beta-propeller repeat protein [Sedimentisphaerales bacterium]|nr:PQQ-binding-like beta-propeller repeat protein [Sedimentisphaerales bacterium]
MICLSRPLSAMLMVGCLVSAAHADAADFISTELLSNAGIQTVWQNVLPLEGGEKFSTFDRLGDGLYVLTTTNYLFAMNASTGAFRFAERAAPAGFSLHQMQRVDGMLSFVAGSSMIGLDALTGKELRRITVPYGVVTTPAINSKFYYMAADDGRVYAYYRSDGVLVFQASADPGSLMTNLVATDDGVAFTTDKGAVVAMAPDRPVLKWRYNSPAPIKGAIVLQDDAVYVAGMDTHIYRFDAATGRILWNHMTGSQLSTGPRVTASVVYQSAGHNGVYALDRRTGKVLWQNRDAADLLSEHNGRAYLISRNQSLIVMENATGRRIHEVNLAGVDVYASNLADGMIYIGNSTTGKIAGLKPTE